MRTHELIYSLDVVEDVASDLYEILPLCSVMTLAGPMGVGKTTLIQALLRYADVTQDVIQSPTFTYLSIYSNDQDQEFYHFDLYRMKNLQEFTHAGFNEYLYIPTTWALIEWPEIIMPLVQKKACHIVVDYHGYDRRRLRYEITDS